MTLRKFMIERDIPAVGTFEREQLKGAAAQSNKVLKELGPDIQWQESYVAGDKTFCVYLARDEDIVREVHHFVMSRLPSAEPARALAMAGSADASVERDKSWGIIEID